MNNGTENNKNNKIKITIYGFNVAITDQATASVAKALSQLKLTFGNIQVRNTKRKTATTLISPHKHKRAQEKFEQKTHKRVIYVDSTTCPFDLESLERKIQIPGTAHLELKYTD